MANGGEKNNDFYGVLGLNKECTEAELRTAYKKLALRWHPDRCPASANSKFMEETKKKFQAIQQAYSVLSDANKRFLYDVGVYDSDDDENGMGDFLNEMTELMTRTKSSENREESFEELQELFDELFQDDIDSFESSQSTASCSASSNYGESSGSNKRSSSKMSSVETRPKNFDAQLKDFFLGTEQRSRRRNSQKQRVSSGQDVSPKDWHFCFMITSHTLAPISILPIYYEDAPFDQRWSQWRVCENRDVRVEPGNIFTSN